MSIIFGYIALDHKPVIRETLETMKKAMDFWGPDGEGLWLEDSCGIGNLLYYNTPEALFEKMPFSDSTGNFVLTAGARIDNREELFTIFDIPLGQRLTMPDSALMLKAYEKWGEACADHLVGDWAMAVWDRARRKLFIARDHHGITALYYYKGEDFFVFSSSLKGILCLPQVPKKINEYKIAQLLVNWNEGGPTTCYLDIMRLPPAHTLTLMDSKLTTNRYWYLEHTPEIRLKNDHEYADMFLHLYTEAVRHRLRSHRSVAATLSSGLDSGSVCILAAKELAKEGKRLQAYTAVPLYDTPAPKNRIANEGPYALALAGKLGNVDVTLCRAENVGVLEGIEKTLQIHNQPRFSVLNAHWIIDTFNNCKKDNNGTVLIGQNGNATISWPLKSLTSSQLLINHSKSLIKFLFRLYKKDRLINESLIKKHRLDLKSNLLKNISSTKQIRMKLIMPGASYVDSLFSEISQHYKLEVRDPTIDLYVLKYLFGLPFNNHRHLFQQTFKDWFSNDIINANIKGIQANDVVDRINCEWPKLIESFLQENELFYEIVSKQKLTNTLSNSLSRGTLISILRMYSISIFLQNYKD